MKRVNNPKIIINRNVVEYNMKNRNQMESYKKLQKYANILISIQILMLNELNDSARPEEL